MPGPSVNLVGGSRLIPPDYAKQEGPVLVIPQKYAGYSAGNGVFRGGHIRLDYDEYTTRPGDQPLRVYRQDMYPLRVFWLYQGKIYETKDFDLTPEDVVALINEAENIRRLRLEKAHALQAMTAELDNKSRRQP